MLKFFVAAKPAEYQSRLRPVGIIFTAAALGYLLLAVVPWPGLRRAPGIVEFSPLEVVRTDSSGFIDDIRIRGGQWVKQGDILAVLANDSLQVELAQLNVDIQKSNVKGRIHKQQREMAFYQAEMSKKKALEQQRDEKQKQLDHLTLRAPADGKIIGRNLDNLIGTYVEQGAEILSIGNDQQKQLRVSIAQEDIELFSLQTGKSVTIRLPGWPKLRNQLHEVEPRAGINLYHASLSAPLGGPLAVQTKTTADETPASAAEQYELLAPRFNGIVRLDREQAEHLRAGQRGYVTFRSNDRTIGQHLYQLVSRWVRDKVRSQTAAL